MLTLLLLQLFTLTHTHSPGSLNQKPNSNPARLRPFQNKFGPARSTGRNALPSSCIANCFQSDKGNCLSQGCTWNPLTLPPCYRVTHKIACGHNYEGAQTCLARGCVYQRSVNDEPFCYFPLENGAWVENWKTGKPTGNTLGKDEFGNSDSKLHDSTDGDMVLTNRQQKEGLPANRESKTGRPDNPISRSCQFSCQQTSEESCKQQGCIWDASTSPQCHKSTDRIRCERNDGGQGTCEGISGCVWDKTPFDFEPWCYYRIPDYYVDCHPDEDPSEDRCKKRGCIWLQYVYEEGAPQCIFGFEAGYNVTKFDRQSDTQFRGEATRLSNQSTFGSEYQKVYFSAGQLGENIGVVSIGQYYGGQPTLPEPFSRLKLQENTKNEENAKEDSSYKVEITQDQLGFKVTRKSTGFAIFDSQDIPGFSLADQFCQISTKLGTRNIYGFGELTHSSLRHNITWRSFGLWNHDQGPIPHKFEDANLYGFHPFFLGLEPDGKSYGILFATTTALNVAIQPNPDVITYRSIDNQITIIFILGESPDDVIEQYTSKIINLPMLPPVWGLGYQLSRYGFHNSSQMEKVFNRNVKAGIPIDVMYADIDYMDRHRDFTYSTDRFGNLPEFTRKLHDGNYRLVLITDPGIASDPDPSYPPQTEGLAMNVFIKDGTGKPLVGKVWPGYTYFPDFTSPNATQYWFNQLKRFHDQVPFDGMWYDMNEPANFIQGSTEGCPQNSLNYPTYNPVPARALINGTICNDAQTSFVEFYSMHTMYGLNEAQTGYSAALILEATVRPFLLSRSTFPGSGNVTAHWSGDVYSSYDAMKYSIVNMLEFGMFGIPWVGTDVCGFHGDADQEMCVRWHQLGIYYPFMRNHNDLNTREQDPASWDVTAQQQIQQSLEMRYRMLPYLNSHMVKAHLTGRPVTRPMFFEYPLDPETYGLDDQFMWGDAFMVTPILQSEETKRRVYVPKGTWYRGFDVSRIESPGAYMDIELGLDGPAHLHRGGYTILTSDLPYEVKNTYKLWRDSEFILYIFLNSQSESSGTFYWDDGQLTDVYKLGYYNHIEVTTFFSCGRPDGFVLIDTTRRAAAIEMPNLAGLGIHGLESRPTNVTVNGVSTTNFDYNPSRGMLQLGFVDAGLKFENTSIITFE